MPNVLHVYIYRHAIVYRLFKIWWRHVSELWYMYICMTPKVFTRAEASMIIARLWCESLGSRFQEIVNQVTHWHSIAREIAETWRGSLTLSLQAGGGFTAIENTEYVTGTSHIFKKILILWAFDLYILATSCTYRITRHAFSWDTHCSVATHWPTT